MPLAAGTRLGPYETISPLGAGGMGEVYRARDARLNRNVALKVLPEIFGTAAYMSPEQARGAAADRRADVWAFGAVLYEMLAGVPAFSGDTVSDVLASVLKFEPDWQKLPAGTPATIRTLLERCLAKDRRQRLQAIGEARIVLEAREPQVTTKAPRHQEEPRFSFVSWCLGGGIAVLVLALAAVLYFRETPPPQPVLRYSIPAPEKTAIHTFAISPDGHYLAIAALGEGKRQLWVRALDAMQPQLLPGTEDASYPFWSPDNRWIGFFAQGKLKKIAVNGGPAQTLCDAPDGRRGAWNRDGVIVFTPSTRASSLQRVPALGGVPAPVTKAEAGTVHRFPVFLPDGRRFLYLLVGLAAEGKGGVHLASLDSQASQRVLADESSVAWFQPSRSDTAYILFVRENTLMAQPVEPKGLQPAGDLFPVAEQVLFGPVQQHAPVALSETGVLVYQAGSGLGESQIAWYDRAGKELAKVGAPGRITELALSPDEKTVAVPRYNAGGQNSDIWLHELSRGAETRLTFHASTNYEPVWLPDGARLVFSSNRSAGIDDLYQKETSGAGQDEPLLQPPQRKYATSCSRDGRFLLYSQLDPKTGSDLWVLPLQGERKPAPFLQTEFRESQGQFSPDGAWIAYSSDESGRYEVYVRPFPAGPGKWKVSLVGGQFPRWRRDGKELFFLSADRKLMASAVKAVAGPRPSFEAAVPQPLFDARVPTVPPGFNPFPYEVAADGKRFLMIRSGAETSDTPLTVVVNWLAGVRR